jgi:hypothetical protein
MLCDAIEPTLPLLVLLGRFWPHPHRFAVHDERSLRRGVPGVPTSTERIEGARFVGVEMYGTDADDAGDRGLAERAEGAGDGARGRGMAWSSGFDVRDVERASVRLSWIDISESVCVKT